MSSLEKKMKGVAKELGGGHGKGHGTGKKKSTTKGKKGGASLGKQAKKLLK